MNLSRNELREDVELRLPPKVEGLRIGSISFQLQNVILFQNAKSQHDDYEISRNKIKGRICTKGVERRNLCCQFQFWGNESIVEIDNCDGRLSREGSMYRKSFAIVDSILALKRYFHDMKSLHLSILHKSNHASVLGYSTLNLDDILKRLIDSLDGSNHSHNNCENSHDFAKSQIQFNAAINRDETIDGDYTKEAKGDNSIIGEIRLNILLLIDLKQNQQYNMKRKKKPSLSIDGSFSNRNNKSSTAKNKVFSEFGDLDSFSMSTSSPIEEDSIFLDAIFSTLSSGQSVGTTELHKLLNDDEKTPFEQKRNKHRPASFKPIELNKQSVNSTTKELIQSRKKSNAKIKTSNIAQSNFVQSNINSKTETKMDCPKVPFHNSPSLWLLLELESFNLISRTNCRNFFLNSQGKVRVRIRASCNLDVCNTSCSMGKSPNHLDSKISSTKVFKEGIFLASYDSSNNKNGNIALDNINFSWQVPLKLARNELSKQNMNHENSCPELFVECWLSPHSDLDLSKSDCSSESNGSSYSEKYVGITKIPFVIVDVDYQPAPMYVLTHLIRFNDKVNFLYEGNKRYIYASALVCIAPLCNINLISKIKTAATSIQRWWHFKTECLNNPQKHNVFESRAVQTCKKKEKDCSVASECHKENQARIIQKRWRKMKIKRIAKRDDFKRSVAVATDHIGYINSSVLLKAELGSETIHHRHQASAEKCDVCVKVGEINGLEEIITLWLENEMLGNCNFESYFSAGVFVTFEIIYEKKLNSEVDSKMHCSTRVLNLAKIIQQKKFDYDTTISFSMTNEMSNYVTYENLDVFLWFIPMMSKSMKSHCATKSCVKQDIPHGSKKVCHSRCPLRAILDSSTVTHFCCPWYVPLTRDSEEVELMGSIDMSFEVLGNSSGEERTSVNLCPDFEGDFMVRQSEYKLEKLSNFNFEWKKFATESTEIRSMDSEKEEVISNNHKQGPSRTPTTPFSRGSEQEIELHNPNYSNDYDQISCRNLSAVLESLDVLTSRVRDTCQKGSLHKSQSNTSTIPYITPDGCELKLNGCIDCVEAKSVESCGNDAEDRVVSQLEGNQKLPSKINPPTLKSVLSTLENISIEVDKIEQTVQPTKHNVEQNKFIHPDTKEKDVANCTCSSQSTSSSKSIISSQFSVADRSNFVGDEDSNCSSLFSIRKLAMDDSMSSDTSLGIDERESINSVKILASSVNHMDETSSNTSLPGEVHARDVDNLNAHYALVGEKAARSFLEIEGEGECEYGTEGSLTSTESFFNKSSGNTKLCRIMGLCEDETVTNDSTSSYSDLDF